MDFDIEDYKARTARLEWDDLDLATAFARRPLDDDSLRCIRYMHDVEFHTVCYLRDLLLTPAHADPVATAFLSFWVFEEFWHGEALAAVLDAHAEPHGRDRVAATRTTLGAVDRLRPVIMTALSNAIGPDFTAVHMTWGAVNEWTTQAGYAALSRRADHPVLAELLRRIMKQEGRHIDFYASQAEARLARSAKAQRLTRLALRRFWRPVGSGVMPAAETRFVVAALFGDEPGRQAAARIDRRIDRLPGLAGLGIVTAAATTPTRSTRAPAHSRWRSRPAAQDGRRRTASSATAAAPAPSRAA